MSKNYIIYTYRIYPNKSQEKLINLTFNVCKEIHNLILNERAYTYNKFITYVERCLINKIDVDEQRFFKHNYPTKIKVLRKIKEEYSKIDECAIYNEQIAVIDSYNKYFSGKGGFPKIKDNNSKLMYNTNNVNDRIKVYNNSINLPKLGVVRANISKEIPTGYNIRKATVRSDKNGRYYVLLMIKTETKFAKININP